MSKALVDEYGHDLSPNKHTQIAIQEVNKVFNLFIINKKIKTDYPIFDNFTIDISSKISPAYQILTRHIVGGFGTRAAIPNIILPRKSRIL